MDEVRQVLRVTSQKSKAPRLPVNIHFPLFHPPSPSPIPLCQFRFPSPLPSPKTVGQTSCGQIWFSTLTKSNCPKMVQFYKGQKCNIGEFEKVPQWNPASHPGNLFCRVTLIVMESTSWTLSTGQPLTSKNYQFKSSSRSSLYHQFVENFNFGWVWW